MLNSVFQPKHSPAVGTNEDFTLVEGVQKWVRVCRESTVFCIRGFIQAVTRLVNLLARLISGENAPRTEL